MSVLFKILLSMALFASSYSYVGAYRYSSCGKNFIFALPPNENPAAGIDVIACRIIVSSAKLANVTIETPTGEIINRQMQPSTSFEYSYPAKLFEKAEVYETFKAVKKTFTVTADDSVSVYVLSIKDYSADGFSAIPVDSWDKEYYHVGYYDYATGQGALYPRGGGFLIVASEDNTNVTIEVPPSLASMEYLIDGKGKPRKLNVTLQKGEAYSLRSEGSHQWTDLTGARITSDKPVGLISFHLRTVLPTESESIGFGRNHISEALPPVRAWGKKFYSLEFNRRGGGDFFRLMASKNDTKWSCKYYDKITGELLGELNGQLDAGQFYEYNQRPGSDPANWFSVRGVAVWETSEPSLLIQYSYSSDWDNKRPKDPNSPQSNSYDPSMALVMPAELYTQNGILRSTGDPFTDNWLNLIILGDPNDPQDTALKSLSYDGKPLHKLYPKLLTQKIPTTDLYWAHIKVDSGAHVITGSAYFTGTLYGFAVENFYSYPIWASQSPIPIVRMVDSVPPKYYLTAFCGSYDITATDSSESADEYQSGLKRIELLGGAQNLKLEMPDGSGQATFDSPLSSFTFKASVEDASAPANGSIVAYDVFGNSSLLPINYDPLERYKTVLRVNVDRPVFYPGDTTSISIIAETQGKKPPLSKMSFKIIYPASLLFLSRESIAKLNETNANFSVGVHYGRHFDSVIVNTKPAIGLIIDTASDKTELLKLDFIGLLPAGDSISNKSVFLIDALTNLTDCIEITPAPADVDYQVCGKEIRAVEFGVPYSFEALSKGAAVEIVYELPFDAESQVELYSSSGERVASTFSPKARRGRNSANFDASAFSAGVYFAVFRSGPVVIARKVLIY